MAKRGEDPTRAQTAGAKTTTGGRAPRDIAARDSDSGKHGASAESLRVLDANRSRFRDALRILADK